MTHYLYKFTLTSTCSNDNYSIENCISKNKLVLDYYYSRENNPITNYYTEIKYDLPERASITFHGTLCTLYDITDKVPFPASLPHTTLLAKYED